MKKSTLYILCTYSLLLLIRSASYAQESTFSLKSPTNTINIDGDSKDWGDSLAYFNAEKKLHYALANDKTNLYVVIKTNDPTQQACIVASGVTFAIDTKGRKKSTYVTTFPINAAEINIQPDNTIEEKRLKTELTDLKKIGIDGFKDIRDDEINFENSFGIQTAIGINDKGYLIYEEAIPLTLFHAGELINNEWSFHIKLNPLTVVNEPRLGYSSVLISVPAGSGPPSAGAVDAALRGSNSRQKAMPQVVPTGMKQSSGITVTKPVDFWGKFTLAKN